MDKKTFPSLIYAYLKYCKKFLIMLCVVICVFSVMAYIYNISFNMILYSIAVCLIIFLPVGINDFYKFYRNHKLLQTLQKSIMVEINNLPKPNNIIHDDYQQLINICFADKTKIRNDYKDDRNDLINYYTMWVHQIKTPIAAMRLLLQSYNTQDAIYADLENELTKIEQYVEMVLNYIKIGSNSDSDFLFQSCNLDDIVKEALHKYAKLFIRKKISLSYSPLNCVVITDKKWLLFVIEQILSNSLKYTTKGTISIYVHQNHKKCLVIEDTGIGIAKEDLPRIFDKGFTGYNGRQDNKSTGIGLYLCKSILNKMNHKIVAESQRGKGTKILIFLDSKDIILE